jgi:hypothetical protein
MAQRFELTPRNQILSDAELIADMRRVAHQLGVTALSRKTYTANGRYNGDNIAKRFGGWKRALERAGLSSPQRAPVTPQQLLDDIRRVTSELGAATLSLAQYESRGRFSEHPFRDHFGTWAGALRRAGIAPPAAYRARIQDEEYFRNLEHVWITLGRQPRFGEMERPLSQYSVKAYEHRFGSWRKALEAFVEYANQVEEEPLANAAPAQQLPRLSSEPQPTVRARAWHRTKRAPSHRLRFKVMKRDHFKCRACGRSPATDHVTVLHVDHIIPWDAGGETTFDNLQTLCDTCNLGKSNLT